MKELLEKAFIAESLSPGLYYLNPDFMWNGDRLAFVKEYRIKGTRPANDQSRRDELEARGQMRIDSDPVGSTDY